MCIQFALSLLLISSPGAGSPKPWPLPWKPGVKHEYKWYDGKQIGKSFFSLKWNNDKSLILCRGGLTIERRTSHLEGAFVSGYDPRFRPKFYVSRIGGEAVKSRVGGAGATALFGEDEITVRFPSRKGPPDQKTFQPPKQGRYWLYGHQAIHHWALFLAFVEPAEQSTIKVFMPEFLTFAEVTFTPEGKETLRGVEATRLSFKVEKLFSGRVWIDPKGRMLRYQQKRQDGVLDVWLKKKKKKK